uniref:Uncharacterized protein n=1 Tax=Anguilla anguilla TaxID=7936 RepID=A0A0E9R6W5_ANGAN
MRPPQRSAVFLGPPTCSLKGRKGQGDLLLR